MNNDAKKILKFLIGAPVTFCGLAIVAGGVDSAVSILVISTVCTLGAGMFFWVPLAWGVGWLILFPVEKAGWFRRDRNEPTSPNLSPPNTPSLTTSERRAMYKYVRQAIACGFSDEKITERLRNQGWKSEEISLAFEAARNQNFPSN